MLKFSDIGYLADLRHKDIFVCGAASIQGFVIFCTLFILIIFFYFKRNVKREFVKGV